MTKCGCGAEPGPYDSGIEVQGVYDGILIWRCGACRALRPRFSEEDKRHRKALEIIDTWARGVE